MRFTIRNAALSESQEGAGERLIAHRRKPKRSDSRHTIDAILEATAQLLQDHGFEDLSTNMICKHAGLTPPALYHYYPNKYAILFELAHTLLSRQHAALSGWIDRGGLAWTDEREGVRSLVDLQSQLRAIVDDQTGALWIIRGMRAIPRLRDVRLAAHDVMLDRLLDAICERRPGIARSDLSVPSFLLSEMIHMGAELELDHPSIATDRLREGLALAIIAYLERLAA